MGRSVPATTAVVRRSHRTMTVNNPEPNDCRSEEEDGSQEGEGGIGLELRAGGFTRKAVPVPDATAVHRAHVLWISC